MTMLKKLASLALALAIGFSAFIVNSVTASAAETNKTAVFYELGENAPKQIGSLGWYHGADGKSYLFARVVDLAGVYDTTLVKATDNYFTVLARKSDGQAYAAAALPSVKPAYTSTSTVFVNGSTGATLSNTYQVGGHNYTTIEHYSAFVGMNILAYVVSGDTVHILVSADKAKNGVDYVKTLNDFLPKRGAFDNPFTLSELQKEQLDGGFKFSTGDWTKEVFVRISGDEIGVVEYGNSEVAKSAKGFGSRELRLGETITLSLFEATFWLQNQPISVTNFVFGSQDCRKADNAGYGWVYKPTEPISFVVPKDQNIKVIQAYDPRDGEVHEFKPGDTAYIGREGATFWLVKAANNGKATTYSR